MERMTGVVTIVQEGRFQLTDDQGASHLFILGPNAPSETRQLKPLAREQTRVRVHYKEAGRVIALMAHKIEIAGAGE